MGRPPMLLSAVLHRSCVTAALPPPATAPQVRVRRSPGVWSWRQAAEQGRGLVVPPGRQAGVRRGHVRPRPHVPQRQWRGPVANQGPQLAPEGGGAPLPARRGGVHPRGARGKGRRRRGAGLHRGLAVVRQPWRVRCGSARARTAFAASGGGGYQPFPRRGATARTTRSHQASWC